jgi:hypothetical protein
VREKPMYAGLTWALAAWCVTCLVVKRESREPRPEKARPGNRESPFAEGSGRPES